jgi:predicted neuraminidase
MNRETLPDYQECDKSLRMFSKFRRRGGKRQFLKVPLVMLLARCVGPAAVFAGTPFFHSELIFPPQAKHVHSSCIVECTNGDLLAAWFHGSGERESPDVEIQGARLRTGTAAWSDVFPMADTPNLPDCNPVLFIDAKEELTLFWIAVLGDSWNHCLLRFRKSKDYLGDGPPKWRWQDDLILTPGPEFVAALQEGLPQLSIAAADYGGHVKAPGEALIEAAMDPGKRQLGWMPRTHLLTLPSDRILFPLYSDGFYVGLMAISDDGGHSWRPSRPIVGVGLNQPSVVRKRDGTLVAYMRREGPPPHRVQMSTSKDDGETWSLAAATDIPNPNASIEAIALRDGRWVMAYNDLEKGRDSLVLALSDDEGKSWKWRRHLERKPGGRFHYPSMIQTKDGRLHLTYTHQPEGEDQRSIKHVTLDAEWIAVGN